MNDIIEAMTLVADSAVSLSTQPTGVAVLGILGVVGVFELLWLFVLRHR